MVSQSVTFVGHIEEGMNNNSRQKGFSLVELLLVVVVVGVIAAVAVPAYQKGMWAAENGSAFSALRTINQTQVQFYSQNSRFGTLPEMQSLLNNSLGVTTGDRVVKGRYVFEMVPTTATPDDLRTGYTISAVRNVTGNDVYRYEVSESGKIVQILPVGAPE
jgi:prepilin-type N-terminal cleavage/methylation domain-containing protein